MLYKISNRIRTRLERSRINRIAFGQKGLNVEICAGFRVINSRNLVIGDHVYIGPQSYISQRDGAAYFELKSKEEIYLKRKAKLS